MEVFLGIFLVMNGVKAESQRAVRVVGVPRTLVRKSESIAVSLRLVLVQDSYMQFIKRSLTRTWKELVSEAELSNEYLEG